MDYISTYKIIKRGDIMEWLLWTVGGFTFMKCTEIIADFVNRGL